MIRGVGLTKRFSGGALLSAPDIEVSGGEVVALTGENGVGKSTAIRMLAGVLKPTSGAVELIGKLGWLPEDFVGYPTMSAAGFIAFMAKVKSIEDVANETELARSKFGLDKFWDRPMARLSRGQRQSCGLAQAFAGSPQNLMLDEPTSALDSKGVARLQSLIAEARDMGAAILVSTHSPHFAAAVANRVVQMGVDS